ncbi:MAG: hypothetical protein JWP02_2775 [Acidimicrobiales bacterium]|nr:hypothetical protein [Acidimicrobiales bacterium]
MRRVVTVIVTCSIVLALGSAHAGHARGATPQVVLHAYNAAGTRLTWTSFRTMESNGKGGAGINDMLVDPVTLQVTKGWPLFKTATNDPAFTWPGKATSLALAWPTSDGYTNLIVDFPGPGTYNFTYVAATQMLANLQKMVDARPGYVPSAAYRQAVTTAGARINSAATATTEMSQGALGAQALDSAVRATTLLLSEYGTQYAKAQRASFRPDWGVTFDSVPGQSAFQSVRDLVGGDPRDGVIRIVFDRAEPASYYVGAVNTAHANGLRVVGQILDSSDMAAVDLLTFQQRVQSYVTALPTVDTWEVGNEVNGSWLGTDVAAKVSYAADFVKKHTKARTLVTLYWQLGEDDVAHSMFNWVAANLPAATRANIDDVGMSMYVEDHPMGAAFDRVMSTLHATFPTQRVGVTELGYWEADLGHTWWWGSSTDNTGAGRQAVAKLYQSAVMGYPYSSGGAYWWYYLQEAAARGGVWPTLAGVHAAVAG